MLSEFDESRRQYSLAFGVDDELATITKKSSCRYFEYQTLAAAFLLHVHQKSLAFGQPRNNRASQFVFYIDDHFLERLHFYAVDFFDDDLWLGNLKLVTFTSHVFAEY